MSTISLSSPIMSDKTLLLSIEDLISIAMGPLEGNTVNFKMIQTVLHILARQMRVLEQKVVLVAGDMPEKRRPRSRQRKRDDGGGYKRRTPPAFETEEDRIAWEKEEDERERRWSSSRPKRRKSQLPSADDVRGRGGRDKSAVAGGGKRGSAESDDYDGRGRSKSRGGRGQDRDDDDRGGRGRSKGRGQDRSDEDDETGGPGRPGGRGGYDRDDDSGGRGRSGGRGARGREDDDERGGPGKSRGGRGRDDDYDDERGGPGKSGGGRGGRDRDDDDEQGGSGRSGGGRGGRGRDGDYDDEQGGPGRSGGRGGRGRDDDDERGGRDRPGGPGGRGRDEDDDERGGRDRTGGPRGRGRDEDDEHGGPGKSGGRGGRGRDDDDERGSRDTTGGPGGRGRDEDDERGGRDRTGGRGGHDRVGGKGRGGERGNSDEERGPARGGQGRPEGGADERGGPGGRGGRDDAGHGRRQSIGVRVEKGPTTVGTARDRGSIAVVTQSQFQLLEDQVDELWRAAGPLPPLTMPDNKQLRQELAAGASLTDAMQAMQVSARVQAAEQAITKLGGLLTQLAASGALPEEAAGAVMVGGWVGDDEAMQLQSASTATGYKSIRIDPSSKGALGQMGKAGQPPASSKSSVTPAAYITKPEMGTALAKMREEVTKALQAQIERAATAADTAEKTAKTVGDKVEELLKMDSRLNSMYSMVEDYSEQLHGFDAGLNTQMASFKEQMTTMQAELQEGIQQLDAGNSNPETAAVMELNERFEGLVRGLDDTLLQHKVLANTQNDLTQQLTTLLEGVEMLREQKADRDELLDILRDKADKSMLEGLVRQEEFDRAQADLEQRLVKCNDKFDKQDLVWMEAIKDLRELADTKAQLTELMKVRDEATTQLRAIDDRIDRLALILGEPKAAMLMRKLARDAVCGACLTPALMDPGAAAMPAALPAARAHGAAAAAAEPPCMPEPKPPGYPDFRTHRCHRWVGGSHTLLPTARAHPAPLDLPDVTRKYTGHGDDGRLYWMETECQPCMECNPEPELEVFPAPAPAPPGTARTDAGDGAGAGAGDACQC